MENKRIRKQICFYPGFHLSYYQTYSDFHFELGIPVNFKTSNLRIFLIHIPMMYGAEHCHEFNKKQVHNFCNYYILHL